MPGVGGLSKENLLFKIKKIIITKSQVHKVQMEKGVKKTVRFKQAYELRSTTRANEKRFKERNFTSGEPRHIKQVIRFTSCVTEDRVQEVSPIEVHVL